MILSFQPSVGICDWLQRGQWPTEGSTAVMGQDTPLVCDECAALDRVFHVKINIFCPGWSRARNHMFMTTQIFISITYKGRGILFHFFVFFERLMPPPENSLNICKLKPSSPSWKVRKLWIEDNIRICACTNMHVYRIVILTPPGSTNATLMNAKNKYFFPQNDHLGFKVQHLLAVVSGLAAGAWRGSISARWSGRDTLLIPTESDR